MKIKEGFILSEFAGDYVAVPFGKRAGEFHGIVRLNRTGADVWRGIEEGKTAEEIADGIACRYADVTPQHALESVTSMIAALREKGLVE